MNLSDVKRFVSKVSPEPNSGCWLWCGSLDTNGYGQFWLRGTVVKAHRASAMIAGMTLFFDCEVDHLCRNKACVNPKHIEPVTRSENNLRHRKAVGLIENCARGHELIGWNAVHDVDGRTRCRQCRRTAARERRVRS